MQLGIGTTMFPAWTAAATLVKEHGVSAAEHAAGAVRAGDGSTRLDEAVRAMTSFDHAIDNARKLPLQLFVGDVHKYYAGYELARQAVNLLVASGVVPGAKERVGRQSLLAAKETFLAGVDAAATTRGIYRRHLADGWLQATSEDAFNGVRLLGSGTGVGRDLLTGIDQVRRAIHAGSELNTRLVRTVSALFDRVSAQASVVEQGTGPVDHAAWDRAGALLDQVRLAARDVSEDAAETMRRIEALG